jgi:branched-chain amino acid transport system ATP-binding protein
MDVTRQTPGSEVASLFERNDDKPDGPLLTVSNLTVRYMGLAALSDVSFALRSGGVIAVVGPNGAGKSTLLNAISGLSRGAVSGRVALGSESIAGSRPAAIARLGVGRSFQHPPMLESETVLQNVLVGDHLQLTYSLADQIFRPRAVRLGEASAVRRAFAALRFTGLADLAETKAGSLPYGTRKIIDIARAIVSGPRLLLLDEPTSGLDANEQLGLSTLLRDLHRFTTTTILIVEHHMNVVRSIADTVIGLQGGTVLAVGPPDQVLDSGIFGA